ncbi:FkbM family methyltransferase [Mucilaginibacter sp. HC2]|uniref:FkbM family methyltransferase n=1 Tax=Mucilaginibacter inviolabilis TaxID=2714892 RepID=UPI0014093427|nr:FkbM family methyltransferase [Mucilaginibacter inviolabilis]NHA02254.1 FkbM family methyltransferase [Mucilaginibacter inviolabilis]
MFRTVKFITEHPFTKGRRLAALFNFVKWQFFSRLYHWPVVYPFTQNSKLLVWKGLTGATGNLYCGLHEFEDMAFLLHLLRKDDLFIDVGANIGSYTILAAAEVGAHAIAIEPIPETFKNLSQNIAINNTEHRVKALNIGLGSKKDILKFTHSFDTGNHVVATEATADITMVNTDTMDNILNGDLPLLIKIDVEGFETEVLKGSLNTLQSPLLKAIIIELNGSGNRYGFDELAIHELLTNHGFTVMKYLPFQRELIGAAPGSVGNTLYVRDLDFVTERLKTARVMMIQNKPL